jgi:hypothetical protein
MAVTLPEAARECPKALRCIESLSSAPNPGGRADGYREGAVPPLTAISVGRLRG